MKLILSAVFLLTLGLNTIQASCISDFETTRNALAVRDGVIGGVTAVASFTALTPVIGPFVLIPIGLSAVWIYRELYLPSSATKMTQLILDSKLLVNYSNLAEATLRKKPKALKRLDLIVKRATGLTHEDGDEFISQRLRIAQIISDSNTSQELCQPKLMKFRKVDEFVKSKL